MLPALNELRPGIAIVTRWRITQPRRSLWGRRGQAEVDQKCSGGASGTIWEFDKRLSKPREGHADLYLRADYVPDELKVNAFIII
ncbi:hypothetical protein MRX96_018082 [Rhipicephalus microplus]